jgi:hypothetical protein
MASEEVKTDAETVRKSLERAHKDRVVDLDEPLRKAIPQIERIVRRIQRDKGKGGGSDLRSPYCLVGDAGWLSHDEGGIEF